MGKLLLQNQKIGAQCLYEAYSECIHTISKEIFVDFKDYYEFCHEVAH